MKSFKEAFQKATGRKNLDRPKEKHLRTIYNTFSVVPFDKVLELFIKQLNEKNTVPRIRTLIVIHFLIQNTNQSVQDWLTGFNLLIESNKPCPYIHLFVSYFTYLKAKTKSSLQLLPSPSTPKWSPWNSVDLLHKTEEFLNLLQTLVSFKKPLKQFHEVKEKTSFVCEITTRLFIDSKEIYCGLKKLMSVLWTSYSGFEAFHASQAEGMFLRYNKVIKGLKSFIAVWTEEYPGEIPNFNILSPECLNEVKMVVREKEKMNTKANLLGFWEIGQEKINTRADSLEYGAINQCKSPKKNKENCIIAHLKKNSCPPRFSTQPVVSVAPTEKKSSTTINQVYILYQQNPIFLCPFVRK